MSYDFAVWVGPRPESDENALEVFSALYGRWLSSVYRVRTTDPAIESFVNDLLERWPDINITSGVDDNSPWSDGPLMESSNGPIFYFRVRSSRAEEVAEFVSRLASERGLVLFDPQSGCLIQ
jgi:hypothetical protein